METTLDIDQLFVDIARYLAAVDAFRRAGCEPVWRDEE
jgi:hypothetical protein